MNKIERQLIENLKAEAFRANHCPWCRDTAVEQEVFTQLNPIIAQNGIAYRLILFPQETKQETMERRRAELRKISYKKSRADKRTGTVYKIPKSAGL
jgi:hypothetical protein